MEAMTEPTFTTAAAVGAAWTNPLIYTYGISGRNILRGPGGVSFDFSIFKKFALSERANLQFRAESFTVLNTPQFDLPNVNIGAAAGTIAATVGNPRRNQFALRLSF